MSELNKIAAEAVKVHFGSDMGELKKITAINAWLQPKDSTMTA
jgi:hypothetical protein